MQPIEQFRLTDKLVVITGGTGLIGGEAVRQMAGLGARVVVGVRHPQQAAEVIGHRFHAGEPPSTLKLDIGQPESVRQFFAQVRSEHGPLDALVNNAFPRTDDWMAPFEDVPAESVRRNLWDHAGGYFLCCQAAAELMKESGGGAIVNVGSIYGEVGPHFDIYEGTPMTSAAAYALIKGGIDTFTKYLATYLGPQGIRVNCLSPGGIKDESHQHPDFIRRYERNTPLGRMGRPEDIAGPMAFLISDASRYITGATLMVDGGWTAW